ncbi:MAG: hypothetical protein ABIC91_04075 [Nanoarchaeota archaeon]|nr:hypothetical protein [Nanoarchaeota archaeon]MBU1029956.1 hypothetical protein [Nanoarchaeota archaeon]MBU1849621.1 hypothetical protein [Nanoarchaeota archaeon]
MVDKKLFDYIKLIRAKGHSLERAKSELIKAGHKIELVEEAISHYKKKRTMKISEVIFAIVIIIAIISALSTMNTQPDKTVSVLSAEEILREAINSKNIDSCLQISDSVQRKICERAVTGSISINSNQVSETPESKALKEAALTKDPVGCAKINDSVQRKICERAAGLETSNVEYATELSMYAELEDDFIEEDWNETATDESDFVDEQAIFDAAIETQNIELCSKITDSVTKKLCERMLS